MEIYLAQGHKAGKCWSWDSNINLNKSDSKVLYSVEKRRSHVLKTSFFTLHHITEERTEPSSSPTGPPMALTLSSHGGTDSLSDHLSWGNTAL